MSDITTYSHDGNWLLVNNKKVLFVKDATPEIMELKVQEYQQEANAAKEKAVECPCCNH